MDKNKREKIKAGLDELKKEVLDEYLRKAIRTAQEIDREQDDEPEDEWSPVDDVVDGVIGNIVRTGKFLKLPLSAQALFFHLCMSAGNDPVLEAYPIMKMTGTTEEDLFLLHKAGFLFILDEDLAVNIAEAILGNFDEGED